MDATFNSLGWASASPRIGFVRKIYSITIVIQAHARVELLQKWVESKSCHKTID
jgi:hypothetical protein